MSAPDSSRPLGTRIHSIWLSQLLLAVVVVVIALLVQGLSPETFEYWTFSVGVSLVVVLTALALALPWQRMPKRAVLLIPLLDILAVGLMTFETSIDFAFLWVFPVIWIATYYSLPAIGIALGTIAVLVMIEQAQHAEDADSTIRLIIVTLSLTFIAISSQSASRQTRAFKRLLRREASKLTENALRSTRQERELSRVLGSIDVGVVRLSADGEVLEVNKTYSDLYDIAPNDPNFTPRSVEYDGYQGAALGTSQRPISRARAGEQFEDERTWLFTADWSWRALSLTSLRLPDDDELASGEYLLIAHDITAVSSATRARETQAARVSHELRNPLTTVLGFSDLILEDPSIAPRVHDRVEAINAAAERMLTLVNQILESGVQAQGIGEPTVVSTDLSEVVSDSVESFAPAAESGGVVVELEASSGVSVLGDAFRLRQVSDNLLSNAIKYTPKGGRVIVEVRREPVEEGAFGGDVGVASKEQVVLRITDTGMGMEPEEVARIFEPYFRSAAARASTISGTGLGMGIVQSLVEQHRGTLAIESVPGRGTSVTVSLPAEERPARRADAPLTDEKPERATTDA